MSRVLLIARDVVGQRMSGGGIRCLELGRAMGRRGHAVTIATPNRPHVRFPEVTQVSLEDVGTGPLIARHDVVIAASVTPAVASAAARARTRLIFDAYDPDAPIEFELFRDLSPAARSRRSRRAALRSALAVACAETILCANTRQRDLWLGHAFALGRIRPVDYDADPTLGDLVTVVPFGLPDQAPAATAPGLRDRFGISARTVVLYWGGSIWNWFDPLTVIEAVARLAAEGMDIALVLAAGPHPTPRRTPMRMAVQAVALADRLGVRGRSVFFVEDFVPYEHRGSLLLDADIGVLSAPDTVETRFSFRIRALDYLWASLPILASRGDGFSSLIDTHDLGETFEPGDIDDAVSAVRRLAADPSRREAIRARTPAVADALRWSSVVQPLDALLARPARPAPTSPLRRATTSGLVYLAAADDVLRSRGPRAVLDDARSALRGRMG